MDLMSKYHGLMKQVTLEVNKQLSSVLQDNLSSHEMERFSQMVDIKKPELKILMIRCAYEICGGQDWQSALSAVSGIQSIIFGCYLNNMLVYKGEEIDSQEGEHRAIKELSHALIQSGHHILEEAPIEPVKGLARHFVSNYFASMNMLADKLKVGNVSTFDDFENYLETYSMFLIFYGGSSWGNLLRMGALLSGNEQQYIGLLQNFGSLFGEGINISNHLGNFTPIGDERPRLCVSQFGDIRNGLLSLPSAYVLWHGQDSEKSFLSGLVGKRQLTPEEETEVAKIICNSGAFDYCLALCKQYAKQSKEALHKLPKSEWRDFLSMSLGNLDGNKYIRALRKFKSS